MFQWGRILRLMFLEITIVEERGTYYANQQQTTAASLSDNLDLSITEQFPQIANFSSTEGTLFEVARRSPIHDLTKLTQLSSYNYTSGDLVATIITLASGLGISYLVSHELAGNSVEQQLNQRVNAL